MTFVRDGSSANRASRTMRIRLVIAVRENLSRVVSFNRKTVTLYPSSVIFGNTKYSL